MNTSQVKKLHTAIKNSTADEVICRPCVYILECKDKTLYTGWTNNFEKRLAAHRSGKGAKYTKGRSPLTPIYLEYFPDKIAAMKREAAIKKMPLKKNNYCCFLRKTR